MFNNPQEAKDYLLQGDNIPNLSAVNGEKLLDLSMKDVDLAAMIMERGLRLGWSEETPLHYAIMKKELGLANSLVEKGINLDDVNDIGDTALMLATRRLGGAEIAKALTDKGAKVDAVNHSGCTALMLAAENGHTEIAKALMEKGAKVDAVNHNGYTALMLAAKKGCTKIAKALIEKGADVNAFNHDDYGALMKPLFNHNGYTALMFAAENVHTEIAKALIEKGAYVNAFNRNGYTALMLAARRGYCGIPQALIDAGADINAKDSKGDTALHLATRCGAIDVMKLLVANGASLKLRNNAGRLPMGVAFADTWEVFLKNGGEKLIKASEYCDALLSENPPTLNYNLDRENVTRILINKLARSGELDEFVEKYKDRGDISPIFTDAFKADVMMLREKIVKNSSPQKIYNSLVANNGDFQDVSSFPTFSKETREEIVRRIEWLCKYNSGFSADAVPDFLKPDIAPVVIKNIEDTHNLEQNLRRFLDKKLEFGYMDFKDLLNDENFNDLKDAKIRENSGGYQVSFSDFLSTNAYNEDQFKNKPEYDRITYAAKEEKIGEYLSDPQLINKIRRSKNVELVEFMGEFLKKSSIFILPKSFKDKVLELRGIIDQKMIEIKRQGQGDVRYVKLEDNGLTHEVQERWEVLKRNKKMFGDLVKTVEIKKKAKEVGSVVLRHVVESSQSTTVAHTHNKDKTLEDKGKGV